MYTDSSSSLPTIAIGAGVRSSAGIVDALRILTSSGNIESGEFKLYGVEKS